MVLGVFVFEWSYTPMPLERPVSRRGLDEEWFSADIRFIQQLLGHEKLDTAAI